VTRLGVDFVFLDATSVTAGGESADPALVNDVPGKLIQLYCLADATSAAIGRSGPELGKNGAPLVSRIACHWAALLMEGRWSVNALP
jgi:hypothetical protein